MKHAAPNPRPRLCPHFDTYAVQNVDINIRFPGLCPHFDTYAVQNVDINIRFPGLCPHFDTYGVGERE